MNDHKHMMIIEMEAIKFDDSNLNEIASRFAASKGANRCSVSDAHPIFMYGKLFYSFTIRAWRDEP